jgi:hypothetical protein
MLGSGMIGTAAGAIGAAATYAASTAAATVGYGAAAPAPLPVGATERMAPMPTTNKWAEEMAKKQAAAAGGGGGIFSSISTVKAAVGFGGGESLKSKQERMLEELSRGSAGFQAIELPSQGFSGAATAPSTGGWKFMEQQEASPAAASAAPAVKVLTVYEREVEKLATMKAMPQRVELGNFHQAVTALAAQRGDGWEELAAAMDAQLAAKVAWQARLNVLTALEFMLRPDSNCGPAFRAYFVENPEDVQRNVHVVQTSLKEKAQKVLRQLGIPERTAEAPAAPAAPTFGAMGNTWMASVPAAPAASAAPAKAESTSDGPTFDGMVLKRAAPAGSGATAAAREAVDKTKLKKRGQMGAMAEEPASSAASGFGATPAAGPHVGAGFSGGASAGWGSDAGWGTTSAGWGETPAAAPSAAAWNTPAAPAAPAASTLDALFGAPSAPPSAAVAPATVPAPSFSEGVPAPKPSQDTLAALGLTSTPAAPAAPAAPAPAPASAAPPSSGAQQLQQQLMIQCQALSAQFMAAVQRGDSAAAQQLMAQQQMLMTQMASLQQQQQVQSPNSAFAALAADARRM